MGLSGNKNLSRCENLITESDASCIMDFFIYSRFVVKSLRGREVGRQREKE